MLNQLNQFLVIRNRFFQNRFVSSNQTGGGQLVGISSDTPSLPRLRKLIWQICPVSLAGKSARTKGLDLKSGIINWLADLANRFSAWG